MVVKIRRKKRILIKTPTMIVFYIYQSIPEKLKILES